VILRAIWADLPERAEAEAAEALLDRWRGEGAAVAPFSSEERIARALRLAAVGRASEAVTELERASACAPPPPPGPLALAKGTVLLALGHPADAEAEVSPHARSPDAGVRRGAQLVLARAAARQRRFEEAIAAWSAVAASRAEVPGLTPQAQASLRDDAEYFAAWLHFDAGELERAADALGRLARERPRSRRAEDARWFSAWALVRLHQIPRADAALRALEDGASAARVRYWRARITADEASAGELLRSVVERDPLGYYGQLSCARLRAMGLPCAPPALGDGQPIPELETQPSAARLRQAAALATAGLRDEALAELSAIAASNGRRRVAPLVAELAAFLGDPILPFRLTRDQMGLSRRTLAWGFPKAWDALVLPAARSAGVDPALVRAVMRRESGFRQEIRSVAGAVGLLQIVPGTATRLASLLRLPAPIGDRLDDPEVNVPLGVGYLSLLLERFGEPLVAIAAYNAGPGAIARWTGDRELPLDAWVESIPFRETRQYVRAVVENWACARAAAGEPMPAIDPDRPVAPAPPGVTF
jgi:soluble lytic murein transglycosylase